MRQHAIYTFFFILFFSADIFAQAPANDDCETALHIPDAHNFCGNYTNINATVGGYDAAACYTSKGKDVWFSFVAVGTEVNIDVTPAAVNGLAKSETSLYYGTCGGTIQALGCVGGNSTLLDLTQPGLIVGETYLIRVQGANSTTGNFQLCIKNYVPPSHIDEDCITATILCDKSPFSVVNFNGSGKDATDLNDASCLFDPTTGRNAKMSGVWFKWTCEKSGSLTFAITPNILTDVPNTFPQQIGDDIDFAVYELPSGISGTCSGKQVLRCEAAGPYIDGITRDQALRCAGATGLRDGEINITEEGGCRASFPHTNFLKPVDMIAGHSYAIGVNNFSSSGIGARRGGFSIDFKGSTGTFQGPVAKINFSKPDKSLCLGETITYTDASTFALGKISKWHWQFGKDASLDTTNGIGPYNVFYKSPGWKAVVLTVTTDRDCQVTTILDSVYVKAFQYDSLLRKPSCIKGNDGLIRVKVTACGKAPIYYNWENTGYTTTDSISNLSVGKYRVAITDSSEQYVDTLTFRLTPFTIELDTAVKAAQNPLCFGQKNGKISIKPANGVGPYIYNFGNGPTLDTVLAALGEGTYNVSVSDTRGCKGNFTFDLVQPPVVQLDLDTFNISCNGKKDGSAVAHPAGGVGNYKISWSNGALGDTVRNLSAGNYVSYLRDGNGCEAIKNLTISEPPPILLDTIRTIPAKCFGDSTGALIVRAAGGTPPYRYSIDGYSYQKAPGFFAIPAKIYNVVVRDSTGCKGTAQLEVTQPGQIQVSAGASVDVELGYSTTLHATVVPSNRLVSYAWLPQDSTISCLICPIVTVTPYKTTTYQVFVKDSAGCKANDAVEVRVRNNRPIFIPTAFSPNGDGVNDFFTIFGNPASLAIKELKIFNRWGSIVFSGTEIPLGVDQRGWDGTWNGQPLSADVYVYYALIRFVDGEEILYKGNVTLIR